MPTTNSTKKLSAKGRATKRASLQKGAGRAATQPSVSSGRESNDKGATLARFSLLETLETTAFLDRIPSIQALARNSLYTIDVRYSDQQVLRGLTGASGSGGFDIPVAAIESLTPLALSGGDPTKIVASVQFRPEFQTLAQTFDKLSGRADGVAAPNFMASTEGDRPAFDDTEADEDPARPTPEDLRTEGALDIALGSAIANYGAVEPGSTEPPVQELMEVLESPLQVEAVRDFEGRTMPLSIGAVSTFLNSCMTSSPRVRYGLGAKVPFHGATPGRNFTRVDCSGFVREAIWRATTPHLNFRDGSFIQHEWIRTQGFTRSTSNAAMQRDGAVRIAFLRQQDSPSRIGHVALVHNARTLESHGGVGPNSRAWTNTGWQARAFVYFLTPPVS